VGDKFYTITRDIYVVAGASEIVKVAYEGLGNETFNVLYNKGKDSSYDLSNTLIKWSMGTGDNEGKLLSAQIDSDVTYALNPSETNISLQLENNTTFIVIAHDKLIEYKKMYPEKDYWKVEVIATYSSKEYKLSFSFELPSTIEINPATSDYTLETISQNGNINSYYKVDIAEMLYENVTEPPALLKDSDNTLSVEEDEEKSNYLAEHEQVSSESFNIYLDKTAVDMYFNAYPSETTLSIDLKLNVKVDGELKQSYDFTLVVEKSKLPKDTTVEE